MNNSVPKPVVLIVLDGWGIAPDGPGNAISLAKIPNFNRYRAAYLHTELSASGETVGLPRGEMGNSETGHLNLGAGRIVFQDLPRINLSIADESFFQIPAFNAAINHVNNYSSALHLMGLIGSGGVHSSLEHIFALLFLAKRGGLRKVYFHLFTDGRDSPPTSAQTYISKLEQLLNKYEIGKIATICGRYFALDRDFHWERTQKVYELMVMGKGAIACSAQEGIENAYQSGKTDEFIEPTLVDQNGLVKDKDAVIFFNFRIDRPRQLTKAFVLPDFETIVEKKTAFDPYAEKYGHHLYEAPRGTTTFKREKILKGLFFVTMTEYEKGFPVQVAFPPEKVKFPFAQVLSDRGLRQFHIAETEKERFVTYYFNGQWEEAFPGEDRLEIPSPKVATYDLTPKMSAYEVTSKITKRIELDIYDFIVVNYANPDMVGHTGVLDSGIKACEAVDDCLGKLVRRVSNIGGVALITADHGNVEEMINLKTGEIDTEHSTNPVPLIIVSDFLKIDGKSLTRGILADVAPTILYLMGIEVPPIMTGRNLIV